MFAFRFAVVLLISFLTGAVANAQTTGCTVVRVVPTTMQVRAGQHAEYGADCPGLDYKSNEFFWKIIAVDIYGNQTVVKQTSGVGKALIKLKFSEAGSYIISLSYGPLPNGPYKLAGEWSATVAAPLPIAPPAASPAPSVAPAPAPVGNAYRSVTFSVPTTLNVGDRATASATQPTTGKPHITWKSDIHTIENRWTIGIDTRRPRKFNLNVVVIDGNDSTNYKAADFIIVVKGRALAVTLHGKRQLQVNEKYPITVNIGAGGVPPYTLTARILPNGQPGKGAFSANVFSFSPSYPAPGKKQVAITVIDKTGARYDTVITQNVVGPSSSAGNIGGLVIGDYIARVSGSAASYPATVIRQNSDGSYTIVISPWNSTYHINLQQNGTLTWYTDQGRGTGTGSSSGETNVTLQLNNQVWTLNH